jgi:hypothetical protein
LQGFNYAHILKTSFHVIKIKENASNRVGFPSEYLPKTSEVSKNIVISFTLQKVKSTNWTTKIGRETLKNKIETRKKSYTFFRVAKINYFKV